MNEHWGEEEEEEEDGWQSRSRGALSPEPQQKSNPSPLQEAPMNEHWEEEETDDGGEWRGRGAMSPHDSSARDHAQVRRYWFLNS